MVRCFWYAAPTVPRAARERSLPTGTADLVIRLSDAPVRIFESIDDHSGAVFGHAVVSGVRDRYHVRDTAEPICSVGAHFRPGMAAALLGVPGEVLRGCHLPLDELWGRCADDARGRVLDAEAPEARLDAFVDVVRNACSGRTPVLHPAVAHVLARIGRDPAVPLRSVYAETGYSQRRAIQLFKTAVGLTPKVYARIRRFQRAVRGAAAGSSPSLAALAVSCGFADQPHLNREFRAFAGISPGAYRPLTPDRPSHVAVADAQVNSVQASGARKG